MAGYLGRGYGGIGPLGRGYGGIGPLGRGYGGIGPLGRGYGGIGPLGGGYGGIGTLGCEGGCRYGPASGGNMGADTPGFLGKGYGGIGALGRGYSGQRRQFEGVGRGYSGQRRYFGLAGADEDNANASAFVAEAKARLADISARAQSIGTPPFFASATYEAQWDDVLTALANVESEGRAILMDDELARLAQAITQVNNAIEKLRQDYARSSYDAAITALALVSPALFLNASVRASAARAAHDAGTNARDLGTAAKDTYGPGGDYDILKYLKWGLLGLGGILALEAVRTVRG